MVVTRIGPSSRASERDRASTAASTGMTVAKPRFGFTPVPPVRKVIEPPGGRRGAACRAQA